MKRFFESMVGFCAAFISMETMQNIIVSLVVAFFGGILAHLGKMLCMKLFNRKLKGDEPD
jgi:hypothetical protein